MSGTRFAILSSSCVLLGGLGVRSSARAGTPDAGTEGAAVTCEKLEALAVGGSHACAILCGRVKCWGANFGGQLGLGDRVSRGDGPGAEMGDNLPFVSLGAGRRATAIAAGHEHTCAILDTGAVKCWGSNAHGQLGFSGKESAGIAPAQMGDSLAAVELGAGRSAVRISAGGDHTCAVLDNGSVACWGENDYGQTDPSPRGAKPLQLDVAPGHRARAVAAGGSHTCALFEDQTVGCWGDTRFLPVATAEATKGLPASLAGIRSLQFDEDRRPSAIAAGAGHTCVLFDDGAVKCWVSYTDDISFSYQRKDGLRVRRDFDTDDKRKARSYTFTVDGRRAVDIAIGAQHACVLLDDSSIECWGAVFVPRAHRRVAIDGYFQPGFFSNTGRKARAIAAGGGETCAILEDRHLWCGGSNGDGQLGVEDEDEETNDVVLVGKPPAPSNTGLHRGYVVIATGSPNKEEAAAQLAEYVRLGRPSHPGYPQLVESATVEGLKPGFWVVMSACPASEIAAKALVRYLNGSMKGAYYRPVVVRKPESLMVRLRHKELEFFDPALEQANRDWQKEFERIQKACTPHCGPVCPESGCAGKAEP